MKDSTVNKLVELKDKRKNYQDFLSSLNWQISKKHDSDARIKKNMDSSYPGYTGEFFLKFFASIGLFKDPETNKDKVRVAPHYEGNRGCSLEADEDLLVLIQEWVEKRLKEIEAEMDQIAKDEVAANAKEENSNG